MKAPPPRELSVRVPPPLLLAAVLFPSLLTWTYFVALAGAFWAWSYHRSGSLLVPWSSHFLADAAVFFIGYRLIAELPLA